MDAEEIHSRFSPDEEYSNNNQSEGRLLEVAFFQKNKKYSFDQNDFPWYALKLFHFFMQEEMPGMEEAYTQYENSQPRCEVGGYIAENN